MAKRELPRGAALSLEQTWALARLWYTDRMSPEWDRLSAADATRAFASIGLTGDFWLLPESAQHAEDV